MRSSSFEWQTYEWALLSGWRSVLPMEALIQGWELHYPTTTTTTPTFLPAWVTLGNICSCWPVDLELLLTSSCVSHLCLLTGLRRWVRPSPRLLNVTIVHLNWPQLSLWHRNLNLPVLHWVKCNIQLIYFFLPWDSAKMFYLHCSCLH